MPEYVCMAVFIYTYIPSCDVELHILLKSKWFRISYLRNRTILKCVFHFGFSI